MQSTTTKKKEHKKKMQTTIGLYCDEPYEINELKPNDCSVLSS